MPCASTIGKGTVYNQHKLHFREQELDREPRQALLEDLQEALTSWNSNGEKIIVFMDANEDIREGKVADMFDSIEFAEHITSRHSQNSPPPATHNRNTQAKPIDGIWSNLGTTDIKCGWLAQGEGFPGDHRDSWIRIPFSLMFGHRPPHLHAVKIPDLTTTDPRVQKRYNKKVKKLMKKYNVPAKVQQLRKLVSSRAPKDTIRPLHP